ncbi:MAG: hypothetical protein LUC90_02140 [Lachnospiraceae bacterium]|nr:hypothetical protein [Lachnospiraceae bacterium]
MNFVPESEIICDILFYAYLFWAAWQDHKRKLVLRGTHLLGFAAVLLRELPFLVWNVRAAVMGKSCGQAAKTAGFGLWGEYGAGAGKVLVLFLCLFSESVFQYFHFYGLADSLVFVNCCLYMWGKTDAFCSFFLFWWMKACSGFLLLSLEIVRRRRVTVKLEEPTAYIPWILGAFALTNAVLRGYNV